MPLFARHLLQRNTNHRNQHKYDWPNNGSESNAKDFPQDSAPANMKATV